MVTHVLLTHCLACTLTYLQQCIILLADLDWDACAVIPEGHLDKAPQGPSSIEVLHGLNNTHSNHSNTPALI